ncbi:MAG: hypothetical protein J2P17_08310 [Mycobacterium sp.]|nr:hypothetical protein [Mycobacterium sp.]
MTEIRPYAGMWPWMTDWWTAHLPEPPLVVINCKECRAPIGEVKRDNQYTMVLSRMVRPEPTVRKPRLAAKDERELQERIAEHKRHVLKQYETDEGPMEVMKRNPSVPAAVAPLETLVNPWCPKHGEISIDHTDLTKFVANTDMKRPKREYRA